MLKIIFEILEALFDDGDMLIGAEDLYLKGKKDTKKDADEYDNPLDCTGFYMSNTETNYGKSDFHRYK